MVDFEYAAPNSAAFDIANHFHEWTADYHSEMPHILLPDRYPSRGARRNFYAAYLSPLLARTLEDITISASSASDSNLDLTELSSGPTGPTIYKHARTNSSNASLIRPGIEDEMELLDSHVRAWSPASHAMWTIWGIVQARDDVLAGAVGEFDYLAYARCRAEGFRREIKALGITV